MDPATPALASIGIDIGKDVFHLVGFDTNGKIAFRRKIKRLALAEAFKTLPPPHRGQCQLGHKPRIIPAIYVKPFVKDRKNSTPRRSRKRRYGRTCVSFKKRPKTSSICRRAIVSGRGLFLGARRRSKDPRLPDRARYCRACGLESPSQFVVRDIEEPRERDLATDERSDRRAL